ncbi:MAG: hypothetical protein B5M56_10665 [Desulfococcus sp. 4484_241]|nr:MAG: hypothetical protein B5M56_10665 [Desulfococcus sp. 4484_241]
MKSEYLAYCRLSTREIAQKEVLEYITFYNAYRLPVAFHAGLRKPHGV